MSARRFLLLVLLPDMAPACTFDLVWPASDPPSGESGGTITADEAMRIAGVASDSMSE